MDAGGLHDVANLEIQISGYNFAYNNIADLISDSLTQGSLRFEIIILISIWLFGVTDFTCIYMVYLFVTNISYHQV